MLHNLNIFVHVLAGCLGIVLGIIAYASSKGGKLHSQVGRLFLSQMGIVVLTALIGVLFFVTQPFLTVVAFLSFYMAYSGYRVTLTKAQGFQTVDLWVILLVMGVVGSFLIRLQSIELVWNPGIVYYMLLYLMGILLFDLTRYGFPRLIKNPHFWLYDHIFRMTSAFTGLVSAGMGSVFAHWTPWNQIIPAILGNFWLIFCLIYFSRSLRKRKRAMA